MEKNYEKIIFITGLLFFTIVVFGQDSKEANTKMDAFTSKTGGIIKFVDYALPNLDLTYGADETKVGQREQKGDCIAMSKKKDTLRNTFAKGPEGWCSYDYHWSIVADGKNIFILTTWERDGGPADAGYVWTDHRRWSADTPENPLSILPLLFYRSWVNEDPIDLRNAEVSVYLRGDNLRLDGAKCLFWVHGAGGRWHLNSQPLTIADGEWGSKPVRFALPDDESLWHHSWPRDNNSQPLSQVLGAAYSYGFSFIGFSSEVTGRLSMSRFEIRLP